MVKVAKDVAIYPNPKRKNRVAVFGEQGIPKLHLRMIAEAMVRALEENIIVYTISTDPFGKAVRQACKKYGLKTYTRKVRDVGRGKDTDIPILQELAVAGLAWRVESFYCLYDPEVKTRDAVASFARIGMDTHVRMHRFLNCKQVAYNKLIFKQEQEYQ